MFAVIQHFSADKPTVSCKNLSRNLKREEKVLAVMQLHHKIFLEIILTFEISFTWTLETLGLRVLVQNSSPVKKFLQSIRH